MFTRKPRTRLSLRLGLPLLLLVVLWFIGLMWFGAALPNAVGNAAGKTDAIVVLTGGSGRLSQGLDLLARHQARKLFVSGVYRGIDVAKLLDIGQQSPDEFRCCVTLGYEADDTEGNAIETAAWMKQQKFKSLRLVTANYHMPRSLIEFRHAMPAIEIVPHPVFPETFKQDDWWLWPGSTTLLAREYSKYLIARVRTAIEEVFQ
jgi:uncharacterized SAM-binding protein YcdF (DUF218 family)